MKKTNWNLCMGILTRWQPSTLKYLTSWNTHKIINIWWHVHMLSWAWQPPASSFCILGVVKLVEWKPAFSNIPLGYHRENMHLRRWLMGVPLNVMVQHLPGQTTNPPTPEILGPPSTSQACLRLAGSGYFLKMYSPKFCSEMTWVRGWHRCSGWMMGFRRTTMDNWSLDLSQLLQN